MSTWTTPITWVNGAPTATTFNTEVRDHLNHLKGALDLITGGTTADTGTATFLQIRRTSTADGILTGDITGDTTTRFRVFADGKLEWGSGSAGRDTNLYRMAANILGTDDRFRVIGAVAGDISYDTHVVGDSQVRWRVQADGTMGWGLGSSSPDVFLSRDNTLPGLKSSHEIIAPGYWVGLDAVIGPARTGWAVATGTATRTTFATSTVTLPQLAERVKALIDDFMTHHTLLKA